MQSVSAGTWTTLHQMQVYSFDIKTMTERTIPSVFKKREWLMTIP